MKSSPPSAKGAWDACRARDPRLGRDVAIKVSHETFSDRFEHEARAAAALNHPNIAQLHDIGSNYLVMALVEGTPIAPTDDMRRLLDRARRSEPDRPVGSVFVRADPVRARDGQAALSAIERCRDDDGNYPGGCGAAAGLGPVAAALGDRRLLSKDPGDRYDSTRDLHRELRQIRMRMSEATAAAPSAGATPPRRRVSARGMAIVACLVGFGALATRIAVRFALQRAPARGADLAAMTFTPFSRFDADERFPAWSPDGRTIAFGRRVQGVMQVFTKAVDGEDAAQLTRSPDQTEVAFWSTDGTNICYLASQQLWSVAASGGTPQSVLKESAIRGASPTGGRWYSCAAVGCSGTCSVAAIRRRSAIRLSPTSRSMWRPAGIGWSVRSRCPMARRL